MVVWLSLTLVKSNKNTFNKSKEIFRTIPLYDPWKRYTYLQVWLIADGKLYSRFYISHGSHGNFWRRFGFSMTVCMWCSQTFTLPWVNKFHPAFCKTKESWGPYKQGDSSPQLNPCIRPFIGGIITPVTINRSLLLAPAWNTSRFPFFSSWRFRPKNMCQNIPTKHQNSGGYFTGCLQGRPLLLL